MAEPLTEPVAEPAELAELELALTDLISDANGEIVFFNDSGFRSLAIRTDAAVVANGRAQAHVTAAGDDVSGFKFVRFDNGLTLYFEAGLHLVLRERAVARIGLSPAATRQLASRRLSNSRSSSELRPPRIARSSCSGVPLARRRDQLQAVGEPQQHAHVALLDLGLDRRCARRGRSSPMRSRSRSSAGCRNSSIQPWNTGSWLRRRDSWLREHPTWRRPRRSVRRSATSSAAWRQSMRRALGARARRPSGSTVMCWAPSDPAPEGRMAERGAGRLGTNIGK